MKIGRNDPCPCGSGKKYKNCCMDSKIIPFPGVSNSSIGLQENLSNEEKRFLDNLGFSEEERFLAFNDYQSFCDNLEPNVPDPTFIQFLDLASQAGLMFDNMTEDEIESLLSSGEGLEHYYKRVEEEDDTPSSEFLGLSFNQLETLIEEPFYGKNKLVQFKAKKLSYKKLLLIPGPSRVLYLLKKISEEESLTITAKGNFNLKFVKEIYEEYYQYFDIYYNDSINSEDRCKKIVMDHFLLSQNELITVEKKKIKLSSKGREIFKKQDFSDFYNMIFISYLTEYDWFYNNPYFEQAFFQDSALFSLFILHSMGEKVFTGRDLIEQYKKAFPLWQPKDRSVDPIVFDSMNTQYFYYLVIELYYEFGFVTFDKGSASRKIDDSIRTTPLFRNVFKWKI